MKITAKPILLSACILLLPILVYARSEKQHNSGSGNEASQAQANSSATGKTMPVLKGDTIALPADNNKMKKQNKDSLKVAAHFSNIFYRYDSKNPFYHIQKVQPIMTRDLIAKLASAPPQAEPGLVKRKVWIKDAYVMPGNSSDEITWDMVTLEQDTSLSPSPVDHKDHYTQAISKKWHTVHLMKIGNHWFVDNIGEDDQNRRL